MYILFVPGRVHSQWTSPNHAKNVTQKTRYFTGLIWGQTVCKFYQQMALENKVKVGLVFVKVNWLNDQYEGCPSKSWTFAIKRDCLSGIL